jgi:predicted hotdog family 3-hydroxylacyl-ACP dehydratase
MNSLIPLELVEQLLPQKKPFAMVNYLYEINDEFVTTGYLVKDDSIFLERGNFNESGMIENIAQSIALYTNYALHLENKEANKGYIGAINNIKLYRYPKLGDLITTRIKVITEFMGVTLVEGVIFLKDEEIFSLKMKTVQA